MFVAEKSGIVKVFDGLADTTPTSSPTSAPRCTTDWRPRPPRLALDPNFPTRRTSTCSTRRRPDRRTRADVGTTTARPRRGRTTDGCVVSGRLSRLTANGNIAPGRRCSSTTGASSSRAIRSAISTSVPTAPLRERRRRRELHLRRLRPDGPARRTPAATRPCGVGGNQTAARRRGRRAAGAGAPPTRGRPVLPQRRDPPRQPATGAALPDNPLAGKLRPERAAHRRRTACAIRSASRSGPARASSGSATSAGTTGRRSTASPNPTDSVVEDFGWPCYEGDGTQSGYQSANLNLCQNLYSSGIAVPPYYTYNHSDKVVTGESCSPTPGSSISGLAFYNGGHVPDLVQRDAVLRRLRAQLHLGDGGGRERSARSDEDHDVRRGRVDAGRPRDRAERRPVLRRHRRGDDPGDQVPGREPGRRSPTRPPRRRAATRRSRSRSTARPRATRIPATRSRIPGT